MDGSWGDNHTVVAGGEWHQSTSSNVQGGAYQNKNITTQAAFLQDTIKMGDKWTFIPGIRMDHHSMFGTHWSPKAALNFQPDNATRFYASWGRVFKAPTADDLYYADAWTVGDPNLKPETGHVETIGFTHEFSEKAVLDMSYFWSELHNHITWITDAMWISHATNLPYEKKNGINISLNGALSDRWSYDVGYSYINYSYDNVDGKNTQYYEPNGYRLGVHYKCNQWKANLLGRFGSGLDDTAYGRNHYAIWDFNTTYTATQNVDIYFKINNLTNQVYRTVPRSSFDIIPLQGRTFLVGANIKF